MGGFDTTKPYCVCRMDLRVIGQLSIRFIESQHNDASVAASICDMYNDGMEDAYYLPIDANGDDQAAVLAAFARQYEQRGA